MARDGDLRAIFRRKLPQFDWQPIESPLTSRGIPDTNACGNGIEFWIENKKTDGWAVGLRPEQVGWIKRRVRHGGKVWIAVRRKDNELWMVRGKWATELKAGGLRKLQMLPLNDLWSFSGGPAQWDWPIVAELLVS